VNENLNLFSIAQEDGLQNNDGVSALENIESKLRDGIDARKRQAKSEIHGINKYVHS
jgi:hypothetical protein